MLKVKDQTLKSRLHRGRLILRKQLADFAGGLTLHRPALRYRRKEVTAERRRDRREVLLCGLLRSAAVPS